MALTKISSHVIGSGAVTAASLSGITTDNVSEGSSNTYFTNARARGAISVSGGNLSYDSSSGVIQITTDTIRSRFSAGTGISISSGSISTSQDISTSATPTFGNITTTGYIRGPSTFTIDPATHGDNTGTLVIAGNLQVDGTTTTINSTTLTVDDKLVTLASGSANAGAANGAGIEVDISGATNPSLIYDGTNDEWDFNKDITTSGVLKVSSYETELASGHLRFKFNGGAYVDNNTTGQSLNFRVSNSSSLDTTSLTIKSNGEVKVGQLAVGSATTAPLHVAKASTDCQAIFGDNNSSIDDPSIRVIGRNSANNAIRYTYVGLDADTNYGYIGYNAGAGGFVNALSFNTSGYVGIGTNAPSNALSVSGVITSGNFSAAGVGGTPGDANTAELGPGYLNLARDDTANAKQILFGKNGAVHSYLETTSSGLNIGGANVGIGTTTPGAQLNMKHASGPTLMMTRTSTNTSGSIGEIIFGNADWDSSMASIRAIQDGTNDGGKLEFKTQTNASGGEQTRLTIKKDGNVGIGITSPAKLLHVNGQAQFENNIVLNENTPALVIPNGDFRIFTGGAEKTRIDSSGRMGIGMTPSNHSGYMLQITGGSQSFIAIGNDTTGTGALNGLIVGNDSTGADIYQRESQPLRFHTSDAERLRIDSSGDLNIVNTSQASLNYTTDGSLDYARIQGGKYGSGVGDLRFFTYSGGLSEAMRIDRLGNVGLGTASPKQLSGQKSLTINASVPRIDFKVGDVFKHHILAEAEYMSISADTDNNQSNSRVVIEADNAVVARFDSDGVKFGADTAAASAIDDYEEGTWTPALYTYGGVSTTSSSNYGIYTKIGNICHIHCKINATLSSLPGQNWVITGLPFSGTNTNDNQQRAIFAIGGDCINTGGNTSKAHFRIAANELHGIFFNASNNTAYWTYNTMDSTTFEMNIHGFYTTT